LKCYQLPGSVTVDWGTFTTTNGSRDGSYSYYAAGDERHFTVSPTGNGSGEFSKFHITTGAFNSHVWFADGYPAPDVPWERDNAFGEGLPDAEFEEFKDWVTGNWAEIKTAAQQFYEQCTGHPRPPRRRYRRH
jgi:hypothetical protein